MTGNNHPLEATPSLLTVDGVASVFDDGMRTVYFVGAGLDLTSVISQTLAHSKFFTAFGPFWNYFDAIAGLAQAIKKIQRLDNAKRHRIRKKLDIAHDFFQSGQLIGLTTPLSLSLAGVGGASLLAVATPLAAASFAVCMWGCLGNAIVNYRSAKEKCDPLYFVDDRIRKLEYVQEKRLALALLLSNYYKYPRATDIRYYSGYVSIFCPPNEVYTADNRVDGKITEESFNSPAKQAALKEFRKLIKKTKNNRMQLKQLVEISCKGLAKQEARLKKQAISVANTYLSPQDKITEMSDDNVVQLKSDSEAHRTTASVKELRDLNNKFKALYPEETLIASNQQPSKTQKNYACYQLHKQEQKVSQGIWNITEWSLASVGMTLIAVGALASASIIAAPVGALLAGLGIAISGTAAAIKICRVINNHRSKNAILEAPIKQIKEYLLNKQSNIKLPEIVKINASEVCTEEERIKKIKIELARQLYLKKDHSSDAQNPEKWAGFLETCKPKQLKRLLEKALQQTCKQVLFKTIFGDDALELSESEMEPMLASYLTAQTAPSIAKVMQANPFLFFSQQAQQGGNSQAPHTDPLNRPK